MNHETLNPIDTSRKEIMEHIYGGRAKLMEYLDV
jgi:hypothetical protein